MNKFDEREKSFEKKFAKDQELQFKVSARRNKYLAEWVSSKLGKNDEQKQNYIQEIIKADLEEAGDEDVFRKVKKDFQAASINMDDSEIRNQMEKALLSAKDVFGTSFENVEYNGIYDVNKLFKVRSEKAHILNEDPDILYMTNMHVILYLTDGRIVNIISEQGTYNKVTYDCYFEKNVKATDESTTILAENLDLLANKNYIEVYNNVTLDHTAGYLEADKINYNLETKHFKVSMFDEESIRMKIIQ